MNFELPPDPGMVGHNYSDYPELDHAPSFAWSGHQMAGTRIHLVSGDEKGAPRTQFSGEEDNSNFSDDQRSMTR
jgi:hypothetical protein